MTPDELLTTTRTVRRRLDFDRPVDPALIRECLTIALQAPSASNAQRWHWVVVTDAGLRSQIGDYYQQSVKGYLRSPFSAARIHADDPERSAVQRRVGDSVAYLGDNLGRVPVFVIPCVTVPGGNLSAGSQAGLWGSVMPAAWSFMLAARSRGLGTAWTTLHLGYETEIAKLIGIPSDVRQAVLIPTAHTIGDDFHPAKREPLDAVLHWDAW
jgi:nitroreductase